MRHLFVLVLASGCSSEKPPTPPQPPLVRLLGDQTIFGQTADGMVFGGSDLTGAIPELQDAVSISDGWGTGTAALMGSDVTFQDNWTCAALHGTVVCRGLDAHAVLPGLTTNLCYAGGTDLEPCPRGSTECAQCVLQWSQLPKISGVTAIDRSCALLTTGTLDCWAWVMTPAVPAPIAALGGNYAITTAGDLYKLSDVSKVMLTDVKGVDSISVFGGENACAVTLDNHLYCWGDNSLGEVGDGTTTYRKQPTLVGADFTEVHVAPAFTCALKIDGTISCWGAILGVDSPETGLPITTIPMALGVSGVVQLANATTILLSDGSVEQINIPLTSPPTTVVHH